MSATVKKDEVRRILAELPDDATWDDLIHQIYVVECVEKGLADCEAGRTTSHEDVKRKLDLSE